MILTDTGPLLSARDLALFSLCRHASALDLAQPPDSAAPADPCFGTADAVALRQAALATRQAIMDGQDLVAPATFSAGPWAGQADQAVRQAGPQPRYELRHQVHTTPPGPADLLHLILCSDLLAQIQGQLPEYGTLVPPQGPDIRYRLAEYRAYARQLMDAAAAFYANPSPTRARRIAACDSCRWSRPCQDSWQREDSLSRISGIRPAQIEALEAAGLLTCAALQACEAPVPGLAPPTLERLRDQAGLQAARAVQGPHHRLLPPRPGKGFDLLPAPAAGDLFYDLQGDPLASPDMACLHGLWDGAVFHAFAAPAPADRRKALADLLDHLRPRLLQHPQARVYHYGTAPLNALRRMTALYGLGEASLDHWLRADRFCDLERVVRGGLRSSEASFALADMDALTGRLHRQNATEAQDTHTDALSMQALRDWLVALRPGPAPVAPPDLDAGEDDAADPAEDLRQRLHQALPDTRAELLYNLTRFHAREAKPAAWAVFDAAGRNSEDLLEDADCLGGLRALSGPQADKTAQIRHYSYPAQETRLRTGSAAQIRLGEGLASVALLQIDRARRQVTLRITAGQRRGLDLPAETDLLPNFAISTRPIPEAIVTVAEDQMGPRTNRAAEDLLSRAHPRFHGPSPLDSPETDPVVLLQQAVAAMDDTVLAVQGPPGTGKTYVTTRAILSLVAKGLRVGVTSNSHEAIRNVLTGCAAALQDPGLARPDRPVRLVRKGSPGDTPADGIHLATRNDEEAIFAADVLGGTAWLFARPELAGQFDYLFVDEAGQVSLANLIAMSNSARNLVLVGDPNQLPQVIQGSHPPPADQSCLDWISEGAVVLPPGRGLFLRVTRRMHPDLCTYISDQFYAGQLQAHDSTAAQAIRAPGLPTAGAWRIAVQHQGRSQDCPEEVAAIQATVADLLQGQWTNHQGQTRPLTRADIIVVAPYNVQVNLLADALPGIRVGTVDKFQGQEAPVALISMTGSSAQDTTRGLEFLLSRARLNVAVSRGKALSLVFAAPGLCETPCNSISEMRLVNALCALPEWQGG